MTATLRSLLLTAGASLTALALAVMPAAAQRRVTPVGDPQKAKQAEPTTQIDAQGNTVSARPASVIEQTDGEGRIILIDTISGREYRDSILTVAPKKLYPLLDAVTIGANVGNLGARLLGQQYGLASVWAELSLWNWIKPMVEVGLGSANYSPSDDSYRYHTSTSPFFKIGLNYNFLYNSNPAYSVFAGLRYGITSFSYSVDGATLDVGYWDEQVAVGVPSQRATAGFAEAIVGLRVTIAANIAVQWELAYHALLHSGSHIYGEPWYVPGYGTRSNNFAAALSVTYTLPLRRPKILPGTEPQQ